MDSLGLQTSDYDTTASEMLKNRGDYLDANDDAIILMST
jgi:hypothetical protein